MTSAVSGLRNKCMRPPAGSRQSSLTAGVERCVSDGMTTWSHSPLKGTTTRRPRPATLSLPGSEPIEMDDDLPHERLQAYLNTNLRDFPEIKRITRFTGGQ